MEVGGKGTGIMERICKCLLLLLREEKWEGGEGGIVDYGAARS